MDIPAAQKVFADWPTPIVATPSDTGERIITGVDFGLMGENHPVRLAYRLFTGEDGKGRSSWDLTAIWFAIMGPEPFFYLSDAHDVRIDDEGRTIYRPKLNGKVRFLQNKLPPEEIGWRMDKLWR